MGGLSFLSDYGQEHFLDRIKLLVKTALPQHQSLPVYEAEILMSPSRSRREFAPLQTLD
jgi:hypothetical protein